MSSPYQFIWISILRVLAAITRWVHPKGTMRLVRFIYSPQRAKRYPIEGVIPYFQTMKINVDTRSEIEWNIFFLGFFDQELIRSFKHFVRPGMTVLDIGANIGCYTLYLAKLVGARGKVIAFEPHPQLFKRFQENLALNKLPQVLALPRAVSNQKGQAFLHSFEKNDANQGGSYIEPSLETSLPELYPIEMICLDEMLLKDSTRVGFIKIDIEGHEQQALQGAEKLIERDHPVIVFEFNPGAWDRGHSRFEFVQEFLTRRGYALWDKKGYQILKHPQRMINVVAIPLSK